MKDRPLTLADGIAFAWCVLALIGFFTAVAVISNTALGAWPRWLCADQYVAVELEVTRYTHAAAGGRRKSGYLEGKIVPGGEQVGTSDYEVLRQYLEDGGREGQRLKVWYWPDHARDYRWWHPPTIILPGAADGFAVARGLLFGGAAAAASWFCIRRGYRHIRAVAPQPEEPATPAWVGVVIVLMYVVVLGSVVYFTSR